MKVTCIAYFEVDFGDSPLPLVTADYDRANETVYLSLMASKKTLEEFGVTFAGMGPQPPM
jgi:hypothetical protein